MEAFFNTIDWLGLPLKISIGLGSGSGSGSGSGLGLWLVSLVSVDFTDGRGTLELENEGGMVKA